jgi:hypothetical protein
MICSCHSDKIPHLISSVTTQLVTVFLYCPDDGLCIFMYVVFQDLDDGRPIVYTGSSAGSF